MAATGTTSWPVRALETGALAVGAFTDRVLPVHRPEERGEAPLCLRGRVSLVRATLRNWPLVAFDRLGPAGVVLTYRTAAGLSVRCRSRSTDLFEAVIVTSGWEYPVGELGLGGPDPFVVVDLGAHIGTFLLYLRSVLGERPFTGLAVEPLAANYPLLQENCRRNGVTGVRLIQAAVAASAGTAMLRTDVPPDAGYLDPECADGEPVATAELGELCAQAGIETVSLLKMDIKGGEYDVLDASWPFVSGHVRTLLMEFHERGPGRDFAALRARLSEAFEVRLLHRGPETGVLAAHRRG
jgi:FkbM family methyltransferase